MKDSEKLDLILEKVTSFELIPEEQSLYELARKHWLLSDENIALIETIKQLLGRSAGEGDLMKFLIDIILFQDKLGDRELSDIVKDMPSSISGSMAEQDMRAISIEQMNT